jgi:hypothetical protein
MSEPTDVLFVATDDAPELGVRAGDRFLWEYTDAGPRLRQIRDWKNPVTLLELFDRGGLARVDDLLPPAESRQRVGGRPDRSDPAGLKLLE